jgi:hypothetical protein
MVVSLTLKKVVSSSTKNFLQKVPLSTRKTGHNKDGGHRPGEKTARTGHRPSRWAMNEMKMRLESNLIIAMAFATCLLLAPPVANASGGVCKEPGQETINKIKEERTDEVNRTEFVTSGENRKMQLDDVIIEQAYEIDGFVLVSYRFSCCFEGMVILYKKKKNGISTIAYHNGYDNEGVFVGFEKTLVVQSLSKHVPTKVRKMLDCFNN